MAPCSKSRGALRARPGLPEAGFPLKLMHVWIVLYRIVSYRIVLYVFLYTSVYVCMCICVYNRYVYIYIYICELTVSCAVMCCVMLRHGAVCCDKSEAYKRGRIEKQKI